MSEPKRLAPGALWWFIGFLALVLVLYAPVIDGGPFVDDWVYVFEDPAAHIVGAFNELHPYVFYRPLPLAITSALHVIGGGSPVPIHLFQFLIHALLALVLARIAYRLGLTGRGALLAGIFVVVTQAAAAAVGGYDTFSISISTLLGTAAIGCMVGQTRPVPAAACFAAALLCKESALGYLPLLMLFALYPYPAPEVDESRRSRIRSALLFIVLLGTIAAAYLAWRAYLGGFAPTPGEGVYNMNFGPGMVRNLAMLWFAALLPVSSVEVFTAVTQRGMGGGLIGVVAAGVVLALSLGGLLLARQWRPALLALVAGSIAVSPVLPLNRVSELYAYTLVPFAALLFGASVVCLEERGRVTRGVAMTAVAVALIANSLAARQKAIAMEENGRIAAQLLGDLVVEMSLVPLGGTMALIDPVTERPNYSVFRVHGFLLVPDQTLIERSGRSDVTLVRMPPGADPTRDSRSFDREITLDEHARIRVIAGAVE